MNGPQQVEFLMKLCRTKRSSIDDLRRHIKSNRPLIVKGVEFWYENMITAYERILEELGPNDLGEVATTSAASASSSDPPTSATIVDVPGTITIPPRGIVHSLLISYQITAHLLDCKSI